MRTARGTCRLTQADLARRIGVTAATMWRYETNRLTPSIAVLARLAEHLHVSMEWLATGNGQAPAALPEAS